MDELKSREDIVRLVNVFYDKVRADELLSPLFAHVHWEEHMPVMYNFWASIVLGDKSYDGNPFQKHTALNLRAEHFERWLQLFVMTVDELYEGPTALEVIQRANSIAGVFQFKLGLM